MAYTALYREWRPKTFNDVVGQEHITTTLKNQILNHRIAHAYLFCGTRGTGKTSTAKVFAKALNCLNLQDGEPCNECEMCRKINEGLAIDVTELDAASNNGVDKIRDIIDDVKYPPQEAKYKVYIMDEVHMLSAGAVNAFLKTLEEPPAYAVILLLTNNKDRLLDTILSRCVSMTLGSVRESEIEDYLKANTGASHADIAFAAAFSLGNIGRALHVLDTEEFKDMLNDTMNVITHMKSMEIYEVVSYAKSLTKYKNEIYDFLDIIMVWYRDMLILKTTGSLNQLVFKDKYRQLKDQEIYISFEGISHILDEVEKARRRLIANVNFEVAIEMLLVTIKENGKVW